jgi:hypothetical protein
MVWPGIASFSCFTSARVTRRQKPLISLANLDAEKTRKLAQPIAKPRLAVAALTPRVWVARGRFNGSRLVSAPASAPGVLAAPVNL